MQDVYAGCPYTLSAITGIPAEKYSQSSISIHIQELSFLTGIEIDLKMSPILNSFLLAYYFTLFYICFFNCVKLCRSSGKHIRKPTS